ncbi:hypothetical protein CRENBAI_001990 [Crenichthys baileyi]|uniref:Uncharacterized protein n=1 Tax=Crenichthys baileyi TaxID=28760 RepID=A0AAV9QXN0_9TELE
MGENEAKREQSMSTIFIMVVDGQIHLSPDLLAVIVKFDVKPELMSPEKKKEEEEEEEEEPGTVGLQLLINPFRTDATKLRVPYDNPTFLTWQHCSSQSESEREEFSASCLFIPQRLSLVFSAAAVLTAKAGKPSQMNPPYTAGDGSIEGTMKKFKLEKFTAGETFGADEALMKKVLKKLKQKDEKKQKHRIIVFCPLTSRVGSDVKAALDTVREDQSIILVLMHHTRDSDYSTAGMNWSETTTNVDLDVHVLFHETLPGLLTCSQNDKAVGQIVDFLKQKKKKNRKN